MELKLIERKSPFAEKAGSFGLNIGESEDRYGAHSIQEFPSIGERGRLNFTHADAQGFMDWYGNWNKGNFWFTDSGVQVWGYEESYDNWLDTYGMDSVVVFYHSGHGGMDGNGVFYAPLGGYWDNRIDAVSSNMVIGNEQLKYLFWSTCQSLKVSDVADVNPNLLSPISTWHNSNQGLRMIFGYQSNSVDNPNYGRYFGNNWNAGQKFSEAWLNASWAISHNQIPTATAMGSTPEEAQNILFNERYFEWGGVAKNWYWWRWGGFERPVFQLTNRQELPKKPEVLLFGAPIFDENYIKSMANELGFSKKERESFAIERNGNIILEGSDKQLTIDKDGRLLATLGDANYKNTTALDTDKAIAKAEDAIKQLNFDQQGADLVYDSVRVDKAQGGTTNGSGRIEDAYVTDTTVIFRQAHKDIKSINNNHGLVMMTYDNDGKLTRIHNSTRKVIGTTRNPQRVAPNPVKGEKKLEFRHLDDISLNLAFQQELEHVTGIKLGTSRSGQPLDTEVVDSKEGYDFSGSSGELVAHREYELNHGDVDGLPMQKIHRVRVPLFT
ncbi:DUF6345 domain-containing protein [Dyadobacter sp. NIV53]|uniref:DUF6345 domain-containing protein n=1 Tax=Dyadobacter sp. NIV53 TaxID=2861765 RepID=UPI001C87FA87|nr:DUF6345 domain-containing protein [Dyadobacter sp. NIV53]